MLNEILLHNANADQIRLIVYLKMGYYHKDFFYWKNRDIQKKVILGKIRLSYGKNNS